MKQLVTSRNILHIAGCFCNNNHVCSQQSYMDCAMTISRALKVDLNLTPFYHCMTRCVRRTFLCGVDKETDQDFSHRKGWIVGRIKQLASIFAINVCAYAVMSNHYHVVLFVNAAQALAWNDQDIIDRWKLLCPRNAAQFINGSLNQKQLQMKITLWRERLMDISWFMRCLNEPIARSSNLEDNCTGSFWEARFKSQALLDEGALLSAMAYVDLNPIRAKQTTTPEDSEFTSIYERIKMITKGLAKNPSQDIDKTRQPTRLMAFANGKPQEEDEPTIDFRLSDYVKLIDTTGRIIREDKKGAIPDELSPILFRLRLTPRGWLDMVKGLEQGFFHAIGAEDKLICFGSRYSKQAPFGLNAAKHCYLKVA
jgi:REP element-mobilizing transposase RayT